MQKAVLIIGTLDTKRAEIEFIREQIEQRNCLPLIIDMSMAKETEGKAAIPNSQVAKAAGVDIKDIVSSLDRAKTTDLMIQGAIAEVNDYVRTGRIDGVISVGGATGTFMATRIMQGLPFGLPKLMVSSCAALPGLATRYFGTADITLMHTVVEFSGLNTLVKASLTAAAGAICGMVEAAPKQKLFTNHRNTKTIAMSEFGGTQKCAAYVRNYLTEKGYEVISFSATGIADQAMENMIMQGYFDGVIELAPGGVPEQLFGGMRAAGPDRLEAAGKRGIPQLVTSGGLNFITPPKSKYKPEYHQRKKLDIDAHRTFIRMSDEELVITAQALARKLNQAKGPVKILIPLQGFDGTQREGREIFDPEADLTLMMELKKNLNPEIKIKEVNANPEDPEFAMEVISTFESLFDQAEKF